jgi:hypothetical protein
MMRSGTTQGRQGADSTGMGLKGPDSSLSNRQAARVQIDGDDYPDPTAG